MSQSTLSKRALVGGGIAVAALAVVLGASGIKKWQASSSLASELMRPSDIPDLVIGDAKAPVTIVEYASMTCGHCAQFHNTVLPQIKAKFIDTGKVRLIYREFPLDNLGMAASMIARCAGGDKTVPLVAALFKAQETWLQKDALPPLLEVAKSAGMTKESVEACIADKKLLEQIAKRREHAAEKLGIDGTPAFFINGQPFDGRSLADFEKALGALVKG